MANSDAVEGAYMGMADLAGLPVDTLLNILDLASAGVGVAGTEMGLFKTPPELTNRAIVPGSSEYIAKKVGIRQPGVGAHAYNAARFATAAGMGGMAGGVKQAIKQAMGGSLSGLTFTEAQKKYPDNPGVQMLASMLPQASHFIATNSVKAGSVPSYLGFTKPDVTTTSRMGEDYNQNLATLQKEGITSATRGMASGDPKVLAREAQMYANTSSKNVPQAAMLKLAEQAKASVGKIVNKLNGTTDTAVTGAAMGNATNSFVDKMVALRSKNAEKNFNAIQDKTTPVVPTQQTVTAIQSLIDEFKTGAPPASGAVSRDLNSRIVSELESIQSRLANRDISIGEAKTLLERYSKASVGKDKIFADLDWRTQERRVAGVLSESLNSDLDVAINSGIADAAALKTARSMYASDSAPIRDFSETAWGQYFNTDKQVTGSEVYKKFMGLPKEQKVEVAAVLPPQVMDSLRKTAQVEMMKKAEAPFSIQKGSPTWDTESWLKNVENLQRSGDYNTIFTPEQRVAMKNNIDALRMTMREGSMAAEHTPGSQMAFDIARVSGGTQGGYILRGITDLTKSLLGLDTETRAKMMFSPLNENQMAKGFDLAPTKQGMGGAIGRIQSADQQQSMKSVDDMTDEEVMALYEQEKAKGGLGGQTSPVPPSAPKSIDDMTDEEVIALYKEEKAKEVLDNPITTEAGARASFGDPTLDSPVTQEEMDAQNAANAGIPIDPYTGLPVGGSPRTIEIIGGQQQ